MHQTFIYIFDNNFLNIFGSDMYSKANGINIAQFSFFITAQRKQFSEKLRIVI